MDPLQYDDFDIRLAEGDDGYVARVPHRGGVVESRFQLPFSDDRLDLLIVKLGQTRARRRRVDSPELDAAHELGGALFDSVFAGAVGDAYRERLHEAAARRRGLRIRLLHQDVPRLGDLPWELLYDATRDIFLANSTHTPLVRFLDLKLPLHPLSTARPLRLLVMVSSPSDETALDVGHEEMLLRAALDPLVAKGVLDIDWIHDATISNLQSRLRGKEYHVFHFVGHGTFDTRSEQGLLVLENDEEASDAVPARGVASVLRDHASLRLVVLNACEGARNSRDDSFAGVATTMVRQGIPAVIAMQFEISDEAAIIFAGEFYAALADGFPADAALAEARKRIYTAHNDTEWATPVLYTHTPDGVLFRLSPAEPGADGVTAAAAAANAVQPAAGALTVPAAHAAAGAAAVAPTVAHGADSATDVAAEARPSVWRRFRALPGAVQHAATLAVAVVTVATFAAAWKTTFEHDVQEALQRLRTNADPAQRRLAVSELEALGSSKRRARYVAPRLFAFVDSAVEKTVPLPPQFTSLCAHGEALSGYSVVPQDVQAAVLALARLQLKADTTADLRGAYLPGLAAGATPLRALVLTRSCLRGAQLKALDHVRLDSADVDGANLEQVHLRHANLRATSLRGADLSNAKLSSAILRRADFTGATLRYADLSFTLAAEADFTRADMFCADLTFAHLEAAVFDSVQGWSDVRSFASAYLYDAFGLDAAQLAAAGNAGAALNDIPPLRRDSARVVAAAARDPRSTLCR